MLRCRVLLVGVWVWALALPSAAQVTGADGVEVVGCEVTSQRVSGGRVPIVDDAVVRAALVGEVLPGEWGDAEVEAVDGQLRLPVRASHARLTIRSAEAKTVMFHARGHSLLVEPTGPRPGDPYGYGFWALPLHLPAGDTELLIRLSGRGRSRSRCRTRRPRCFSTPVIARSSTHAGASRHDCQLACRW